MLVKESNTVDNKKIREKKRHQEYYIKNKERILKHQAEYERTHREQRNAAQNRRNAKPERRALNRKRGLDYFYAHKDEIIQKKQANPEFYSAQSKKWRTQWRSKLFDILGRKCVRCGYEEDIDCLQFDHIKGDRKNDKKYQTGMHNFCRYYALNPEEARQKLQVLCIACNYLKDITEDRVRIRATKQLKQTKIAIYDRNRNVKRRFELRLKLFDILGGAVCKQCNSEEIELLQFDHINGGGKQERKQYNGHNLDYYARNPIEAKKKLQVLCIYCNLKKERK